MLMRSLNQIMTKIMRKPSLMNLTLRAKMIRIRNLTKMMKNPPKNLRTNPMICLMNLKSWLKRQRRQIMLHQKKIRPTPRVTRRKRKRLSQKPASSPASKKSQQQKNQHHEINYQLKHRLTRTSPCRWAQSRPARCWQVNRLRQLKLRLPAPWKRHIWYFLLILIAQPLL